MVVKVDDVFSHFDTVHKCSGQTDGLTGLSQQLARFARHRSNTVILLSSKYQYRAWQSCGRG